MPRSRQQQRHHRQHRDPDTYYEERWVERRTRRRANRRRLSREDSRSFSEEELRHHSKASNTAAKGSDRQRRALSENARYDATVEDEDDLERKGTSFGFSIIFYFVLKRTIVAESNVVIYFLIIKPSAS